MLAWVLPTGDERYTLWCPATLKMGEVTTDKVTILSPFPIDDTEHLAQLIHDHLFRYQMRVGLPKWRGASFWFRQFYGLAYLIGMDNLAEDLICGLYLLVGLPVFTNAVEALWKQHQAKVMARFSSATYMDEPEVILCPRLAELAKIVSGEGLPTALHSLLSLGLPELLGFYRRAAWSTRWEAPAPIGMGVFRQEDGGLQCSTY